MNLTLILRSDGVMSDIQKQHLQKSIEELGLKGLIVEQMDDVQLHQPIPTFRETSALAFMRDLAKEAHYMGESVAPESVRMADALIAELAKAKE